MNKLEMLSTENENVIAAQENADLLEDLFAFEVVDTAYTCHENRSGGMQRNLVSHCVFRPVSGREHHVSDDILAGIEGCGYKDQACFFVAYHDDSGWSGCSSNHGVYCG